MSGIPPKTCSVLWCIRPRLWGRSKCGKAKLSPWKTCECGMSVWRSNYARHQKSASHLAYEASLADAAIGRAS